jgi:hypothetical protein
VRDFRAALALATDPPYPAASKFNPLGRPTDGETETL